MRRTYLVFGRREYAEPLEHQGVVHAELPEEAARRASADYPGPWVELVLVPLADAYWVVGPTQEEQGVTASLG